MDIHRVSVPVCLQEGGELYFSDVYSNGRLTEEIKSHKVLWGV